MAFASWHSSITPTSHAQAESLSLTFRLALFSFFGRNTRCLYGPNELNG